jgi:hypothetical protein
MNITFLKSKLNQANLPKKGWGNQDIADFYRAVDILKQAGLETEVDSGTTDEGDPWFVFVRPESGEVVAHFAHIDGWFIAVSSVNHQMYKGKNIRNIIDQMLTSYPVLLPQTKGGAKLYLHPTAAISAFLAAAFILTVDGVKVSDLGAVISNAMSDKRDNVVHNDLYSDAGIRVDVNNTMRLDPIKGTISDIALSNANLAVLGAALIVHQLSHPLEDEVVVENQNDISIALRNSVEAPDSETESSIILASKYRHLESNAVENDVGEAQTVGVGKEESKKLGANNGVSKSGGESQDIQELFSRTTEVDGQSGLVQSLEGFGSLVNLATGNTNKLVNKVIGTETRIEESDGSQVTHTAVLNGKLESPAFPARAPKIVENIDEFSEIFSTALRVDSGLPPATYGLAVDELGGLQVWSFESFMPTTDSLQGTDIFFPIVKTSLPGLPELETGGLFEVPASDNAVIESELETVQPLQTKNSLPILGHTLDTIEEKLELTEAVDVVFYNGGDATISNFNLGTDLLWFFLTLEQIEAADNRFNGAGDLILDFGELGTLTFLSIVEDSILTDAI